MKPSGSAACWQPSRQPTRPPPAAVGPYSGWAWVLPQARWENARLLLRGGLRRELGRHQGPRGRVGLVGAAVGLAGVGETFEDQVRQAVVVGDAVEVPGADGLVDRHHRGVADLGHVEHATLRVVGVHVRGVVVRRADAHGGRVGVRRDDLVVILVRRLDLQDRSGVTVLEDPGDGAVLADRDREGHAVELGLLHGQVVGVGRDRDVARAGGLVVGADGHDLGVVVPDVDVQTVDGLHLERLAEGLEASGLAPERVGDVEGAVAGRVAVDRLAGLVHGGHDRVGKLLDQPLTHIGLAVDDVAEHDRRGLALAAVGHAGHEVHQHERVGVTDDADGLRGERGRPIADGPVAVGTAAGRILARPELDPARALGAGVDLGGRERGQSRGNRGDVLARLLHAAPPPFGGEGFGSMPTLLSTIGLVEKKKARGLAARKYTGSIENVKFS